jgi:hypothetical protein
LHYNKVDTNKTIIITIVYCYLTDARSETSMNGFKMVRLSLDIDVKKIMKWGAYMGSGYNGIFR